MAFVNKRAKPADKVALGVGAAIAAGAATVYLVTTRSGKALVRLVKKTVARK